MPDFSCLQLFRLNRLTMFLKQSVAGHGILRTLKGLGELSCLPHAFSWAPYTSTSSALISETNVNERSIR